MFYYLEASSTRQDQQLRTNCLCENYTL